MVLQSCLLNNNNQKWELQVDRWCLGVIDNFITPIEITTVHVLGTFKENLT